MKNNKRFLGPETFDNLSALPELMFSLLKPKANSIIYHQFSRFNEIKSFEYISNEFNWKKGYTLIGSHPHGIPTDSLGFGISDEEMFWSKESEVWGEQLLPDDKFKNRADYGIGFPPMAVKNISTSEYLENMLEIVKDSGRIVFVSPLSFLFSKKNSDIKLKERLIEEGLLEAVIKLPNFYIGNSIQSAILIIDSIKKNKQIKDKVNFFNYQNLNEIVIRKNIQSGGNDEIKIFEDFMEAINPGLKHIEAINPGLEYKDDLEEHRKVFLNSLGIPTNDKEFSTEDYLSEINTSKEGLFMQGNFIIRKDYEQFAPNDEYITLVKHSDIQNINYDLSVEYHAFFSDLKYKFSSEIGINEFKTLGYFSKDIYLIQPERKNRNIGSRKKNEMIKKFGEKKLMNSIFIPTIPTYKNLVINDYTKLVKGWGYVGAELDSSVMKSDYAILWFNSKWVKIELISRSQKSTIPYLKVEDVFQLPIPNQSIEEQELAINQINKIEESILEHQRMVKINKKIRDDVILKPEETEIPEFIHSNIENEIKNIINKGEESISIEFKSTFHTPTDNKSDNNKNIKKELEDEIWKTICAFLNTHIIKGEGLLLIGVKDNGEIKGLEISEKKDNYNFENIDKFRLYFEQKLKINFNMHQIENINTEHVIIDDKYILVVKVKPLTSDSREAYITPFNKNTPEYYIRRGPQDEKLEGPDLVDHIDLKRNYRK